MFDLLATNALTAGQTNIITKSKAPAPRADQPFEHSLQSQQARTEKITPDTNRIESDRDDPAPLDDPPETIENADPIEPNLTDERDPDTADALDAPAQQNEANPDDASLQEDSDNSDNSGASDIASLDISIQPAAAQSLDHLAALAQLAQTTKSVRQASQDTHTQDTNPKSTTASNARSVDLHLPTASQQESPSAHAESQTKDASALSAQASQSASTLTRPTSTTNTPTASADDASHDAPAAQQDNALASVARDLSQDNPGTNADQKNQSRLIESLKQNKSTLTKATSGQIDPFKVTDSLNQPPPTAVLKPTLAPQQSPIHLQAVDAGDKTASLSQPAQERGNLAAVTRGLAAAVRQRGGLVTIKLSPESLGPVRIQMSIQQGNVNVRFDAASEQTRDMLQRNMDSLRSTLQSKGFGIERLSVQTSPGQFDTGSRDSSQQSQQDRLAQQHNHDASDGKSKGHRDNTPQDQQSQDQSDQQDFDQQWRLAVNATA